MNIKLINQFLKAVSAAFMQIYEKFKKLLLSSPRVIFINFYRLLLRNEVFFSKRLPADKHAILAINHVTGADPVIVLASLKKRIIFLADSRCFETRFTSFFFRKLASSVPVFKNQFTKNTRSFKELFQIFLPLKSKIINSRRSNVFLGIFPEGKLNKSGCLDEFFKGAAYLSYKLKLPIIPVYLANLFKGSKDKTWLSGHPVLEGMVTIFGNIFKKIHIFIGEPIEPVAENIISSFKDFTDREKYITLVDKINSSLQHEFLKLENDAREILYMLSDRNPETSEVFATDTVPGISGAAFSLDSSAPSEITSDSSDSKDFSF